VTVPQVDVVSVVDLGSLPA